MTQSNLSSPIESPIIRLIDQMEGIVMENVKKIVVPIDIRALKTANVYEIEDSHILVDSGMSGSAIAEIERGGVDLDSIKLLVLTHLHIDHVGGAKALNKKHGIPVAMGKRDARVVMSMNEDPDGYWNRILSFMLSNGMPGQLIEQIKEMFLDPRRVDVFSGLNIDRVLTESELDSNVSIVENPGHTMGSISLLLRDRNVMFVGDHIISKITPNISSYTFDSDVLGNYMASLDKIRDMKPRLIFPGHRDEIHDVSKRIDEIKAHHYSRLKEVEQICLNEWKNAYEIAGMMRWSNNRSMGTMNVMETNFAVGEAISHLVHLHCLGRMDMRDSGGITQWRTT